MSIEKFVKDYDIRTYEIDKNKELRLVTLMNIFQDIADSHASNMGLGLEYCLEHGVAWVGANYHLVIERMPKLHEKVKLISWPSEERKFGAIRDFAMYGEDGNLIIKASSQWVLIDFNRKRPILLRDNLPQYKVIEDKILVTDFPKIEDVTEPDVVKEFCVRFDDIDLNNHVNNAIYPLWASEAVEAEFRLSHKPAEIEIAFKKEGLFGEGVKVLTKMEDETSIHSIKSTIDERELAKVKIKWKRA